MIPNIQLLLHYMIAHKLLVLYETLEYSKDSIIKMQVQAVCCQQPSGVANITPELISQ